jgi:site-specific recombinase XerD
VTRTDSLITGAIKAIKAAKNGSAKTQHNHIQEAKRFTETLRLLGYGVKQWKNLSNKHVGAVVKEWKNAGLATGTIKEYLSGVRAVARLFNNHRIAEKNSAFGIENRVYVSNRDKSVSEAVYERIVTALKASANINDNRVAAQLQLQRELGLRKEEAFKFQPASAVMRDGTVFIQHGTKGGRERIIHHLSAKAKEAIAYAKSVVSGKNTIPNDMTERQWECHFYKTLRFHGLSQDSCGASSHGLRHAYAQARYEQMTGFEPRCKFESSELFRANAERTAGADWARADQDARQIIKAELGHGPNRDDVMAQYLGSKC